MNNTALTLMALALAAAACSKTEKAESTAAAAGKSLQEAESAQSTKSPAGQGSQKTEEPHKEQTPEQPLAAVGSPAPHFELPDLEGKQHSLASLQGKVVVLEWFNPECPFVKASHTKGSLVDAAERFSKKGVTYLAINSGAVGRQGHGVEANRKGQETFGLKHPILLDEAGTVGHAYGATNTPHVFVIDQKGILVYAGAPDNSPDGEKSSPEGGTLISYLDDAVEATLAGKPVSTPKTKAYGCSVKYEK